MLYVLSRLESIYNFLSAKYISKSQIYIALYVLNIFEGTCNPLSFRYTSNS